jgi:hypothetical protein
MAMPNNAAAAAAAAASSTQSRSSSSAEGDALARVTSLKVPQLKAELRTLQEVGGESRSYR